MDSEINETDKLWAEIGFHRPIAGYWFKLVINIIEMIVSIIIYALLFNILFPFPESIGYKTVITGLFTLLFVVFDLGTCATIDRFVAEAHIKNPSKMIQYIQYFIWYQMTTGLIQTTMISFYALFVIPRTELAYGIWLMLIVSTFQYPGFLGVFRGVMNTLQFHNKVAIVNFIQGELFQRLTEYGCILIGKWYGANHPEIGEIMGIAIGSLIGKYLDDFIATLLSAKFFSQIMKSKGITAKQCFHHDFDIGLVKECLSFGIKTGISGILGIGVQMAILWQWIVVVPQYTTFVTLFILANTSTDYLNRGAEVNLTPLISESFMNGKKELTKYYVAQTFRFITQNLAFFLIILGILYFVLEDMFTSVALYNYLLTIPFFIPLLIKKTILPYCRIPGQIFIGADRATTIMKLSLLGELGILALTTLLISVLRIPNIYGLNGIILVMVFADIIPILMVTFAGYHLIRKRILPIKILWWQSFGATFFAFLCVFIFNLFLIKIIYPIVFLNYGFIVAGIIFLPILILSGLFIYYPLTAFFGGWDDNSIRDFKKAVKMSGPSKFLTVPMDKLISYAIKHSRFHNKFSNNNEQVVLEIKELEEIKSMKMIKN